jgi:cell wall-associated NlpC family hydrolase
MMRSPFLDVFWKTPLTRSLLGVVVVAGLLAGCSSSGQIRDEGAPPPRDAADADTAAQDQDEAAQAAPSSETQEEEEETQLVMVMNPDAVNQRIEKHAEPWYGTPYEWGGESKDGVDCSGFIQAVYETAFDWLLPRVTEQQVQTGRQVQPDELRAGDLVFFHPEDQYNHVGIYLKDNKFVHASSNDGVSKASLENRYWQDYYWTARRLLEPTRIPDTLKKKLLTYRSLTDSAAASDHVLAEKEDFPLSKVEGSQSKRSPSDPPSLESVPQGQPDQAPTPTLASMATATAKTERIGW